MRKDYGVYANAEKSGTKLDRGEVCALMLLQLMMMASKRTI